MNTTTQTPVKQVPYSVRYFYSTLRAILSLARLAMHDLRKKETNPKLAEALGKFITVCEDLITIEPKQP